jgi:signal transduction histidine kinase/ligand-binding sensor domain-containing protein
MRSHSGVAATMFKALGDAGINIGMISTSGNQDRRHRGRVHPHRRRRPRRARRLRTRQGDVLRDGRFHFELAGERMPGDWVMRLVAETPTLKYFATYDGTLLRRETGKGAPRWARIRVDQYGPRSRFAADAAGVIWCARGDGSLHRLEGDEFVEMPATATAASGRVLELVADTAGTLWAGCERGLARWTGEALEIVPAPPAFAGQELRQILPTADGSLWASFAGGFAKWNGSWLAQTGRWELPELKQGTPELICDGGGGLWYARSGEGLWHVSATGRVAGIPVGGGLPNPHILQMTRDFEGNLWLGLRDGGLVRLRTRIIRSFEVPGLNSLCEDAQGNVWLAGQFSDLLRVDEDQGLVSIAKPAVFGDAFTSVLPAVGGGILLSSPPAGLWHHGAEGFRRILDPVIFGNMRGIRVLYRDRHERLWLSNPAGLWMLENGELRVFGETEGHGMVKMDPPPGSAPPRLDPPFVEAMAEDLDGDLWLGLAQGELRRFRGGRFESFRPPWAQTWMRFCALLPDPDGGLWIGTLGSGLLHFQNGKFQRFTEAHGLVDDYVSQVLDDGSGHLWLGTRTGITRIPKAGLREFFAGRTQTVGSLWFGKMDGLPNLQATTGAQPSCWRGRDGRLWFANTAGAAVIDPAKLRTNPLPPAVVIERVIVDGTEQSLARSGAGAGGRQLVLGPGKHHLSFHFAALSLSAPEKIRYRWRMEGADEKWQDGGDLRTASYGLLPPGRYRFHVAASNNDGVWNQAGASLPIVMQPHFWQTWWFKPAATMAALGLLLLGLHRRQLHQIERMRHEQAIARQRLEHQQSLERERARIARDLHDDLGANLTSIALVADVGRKRKEHLSEVDAAFAGVAATARESVREMDAIVWALNTHNDSLDHFASFLSHYAEDFFQPTGISCELRIPDDLPEMPLSNEGRHCLFLAAKEALNNIARHAQATSVRLELACVAGRLELSIADNGRGLPAAPPASGQDGLHNLRERLAMLGGELQLETPAAGGVVLHLIVPLENIRCHSSPWTSP